jgi:predicted alpha/beta-fold hydrolase
MFRGISMPPSTRETWQTSDGDSASIERVRGRSDAPRLIILHGLEGGTHSTYARGLLHEAYRRGWWGDLALWRTCDGRVVNDVARSYHSGASDDAGELIAHILAGDPDRPTYLLGVSLGGNVLLKWLGERGQSVPDVIRGAVAISVPFDLGAASSNLERGFSRIYSRFFLRSLRAKAIAKLGRFPHVGDRERIRRAATLREFDDLVTAPLHGFANADDYYRKASSKHFLGRIEVPTLLFNAQDDPFLPRAVLDEVRTVAARNRFLTCFFPPHGGHAGFVSGRLPWRPTYWMEPLVLDWLSGLSSRSGDSIGAS